MTRASLLYLASFGAHAALAVGVVSLKGARKAEDISIAVIERAKTETKKSAAPPAPPPEAPVAKAAARAKLAPKAAVAAKAADAPPPAAGSGAGSDIPDFGLSLGGGGPGGLAVPASGPRGGAAPEPTAQVSKKVLAAPAVVAPEICADPPTKPKVIAIGQPAYTQEARDANVAGKVRVELSVDASGHVASARVLEGLGHGLDEAALAAARAATFEPATRCGKAAAATFVIAMRFTL